MEAIFVSEKGKGALSKLKGDLGSSGKAKVIGKKMSAKKSKSAPKSSDVGEITKKIIMKALKVEYYLKLILYFSYSVV